MSEDLDSKISINVIIELIKKNPSRITISNLLTLLSKEKYCHLKEDILNLSFDKFNTTTIFSQEDCIKSIIDNKEKIINLPISEIQKIIGNCDKMILIKTLKFLEGRSNTGYVITTIGSKRSKRYSLQKQQPTISKEDLK